MRTGQVLHPSSSSTKKARLAPCAILPSGSELASSSNPSISNLLRRPPTCVLTTQFMFACDNARLPLIERTPVLSKLFGEHSPRAYSLIRPPISYSPQHTTHHLNCPQEAHIAVTRPASSHAESALAERRKIVSARDALGMAHDGASFCATEPRPCHTVVGTLTNSSVQQFVDVVRVLTTLPLLCANPLSGQARALSWMSSSPASTSVHISRAYAISLLPIPTHSIICSGNWPSTAPPARCYWSPRTS